MFQLRNFDVVLMILVSAYLGLKSRKSEELISYLVKRFKRLVLPTWIFISFFLLLKLCLGNFDLGLKGVLATYALSNFGMGYVWIIRIYFIVAILVPLYKVLCTRLSKIQILVLSLLLFVSYELLCHAGVFNNKLLDYLIAYFIPCFLLLVLAKIIFESEKWNNITIMVSFLIFVAYAVYLYRENGYFIQTQEYKYPFQLYYLSYGILASGILIKLTKRVTLAGFLYDKVILFISSHLLWIYLWHIIPVTLLNHFGLAWYIKYVLVLIIASAFTVCQSKIVEKLQGKANPEFLNIFRG